MSFTYSEAHGRGRKKIYVLLPKEKIVFLGKKQSRLRGILPKYGRKEGHVMKRSVFLMVLVLLALVFVLQTTAQATRVVGAWTTKFTGIQYATGTDDAPLMKAFAVKVDLQSSYISLFASHDNGTAAYETALQTPTAFLSEHGLKVAVNASFYDAGLSPNTDIWGFLVSNGTTVSGSYAAPFNSYLSFTSGKVATIGSGSTLPAGAYNTIAGAEILLVNGVNNGWDSDPQPATSYGISQDGRYLIICVVDGRQAGWSDGATPYQMMRWMLDFGAWNAVKMDGGGSSCMTISGMGSYVNRPCYGYARAVGASLGVLSNAPPPTEVIVDNPAGSWSANWVLATSSTDKYGADYRYRMTAAISDPFTWTPNLPTAGNWEVYAWWSQGSNRSQTAPYIVYYNGGNITRPQNQQANGGKWNSLGTYSFAAGTGGCVKLSCWTTTGFVVIADAVKFVKR